MPRRGDPSGRAFASTLQPTFRLSQLFRETISETSITGFLLTQCGIPNIKQKHLHSPVIQMGTPGLVQEVRCDAAISCHTPGVSDEG